LKQSGDQDVKMMMRGLIGSRPPRCERVRCRSCGHCEAIQVPTNPQTKLHSPLTTSSSSSSETIHLDYTRGDDSTNYKPMSWKCKCGNSIYNPWRTFCFTFSSTIFLFFFGVQILKSLCI